jgi:hypothetical protein
MGYFNRQWVQAALGVPLNFTVTSTPVLDSRTDLSIQTRVETDLRADFLSTGDFSRSTIPQLNKLLDNGVKIVLIYGDRDYQCNCTFTTSPYPLRDTLTDHRRVRWRGRESGHQFLRD